MSTRNQIKSRYSRLNKKGSYLGEEDVIEIKEPMKYFKPKAFKNIRRKDLVEYTSSEATTPYKQENKPIKKKKENDIEIFDLSENPSKSINKRKKITTNSTFALRNKRAKSITKIDLIGNKISKKPNKSTNKLKSRFISAKKGNKVVSINLEESEDEIRVVSPDRNTSRFSKKNIKQINIRKLPSKTPVRKFKKKFRKHTFTKPKRKLSYNKSIKQKNKITQLELSSESEIEETQEMPKKNKISIDSKKQDKKAKSTFKGFKEKNNSSFLGKKRKKVKSLKSLRLKTPNKSKIKSPIQIENNNPIEIDNSPIKIREGKSTSKTPTKSSSKQIRNIIPISTTDNTLYIKNNNGISDGNILKKLNRLIDEFGFQKVLDSLCKSKLNQKNNLELNVHLLKESCPNEKLPLYLIKMMFSYFDNKIENKDAMENIYITDEKEKAKERNKKLINVLKSLSTENNTANNEINEIITEKPISKSPTKSSTYSKTNKKNQEVIPMEIDEQITNAIHLTEDGPNPVTITKSQKREKKNAQTNTQKKKAEKSDKAEKSPIKIQADEPKKEKKNMSIGSHYHKDGDGLVYKYQVCKLDGQGNAIFKCYDDKCKGEGVYDLDSRIFKISTKHSLGHKEHDYIVNFDKSEDNVFKEMINMNKHDAQVFKEGNVRTVKIY